MTDKEHDEVVALGGLHILGTERHESRRIDNQLRGRAGRQGDPGSSRFYLSLQDDLLRIFGGERMQKLMLRLGMEEDVPIESKLITKRIAAAQKAVETQNFEARKHLLEYDDVMNKQRQAVYGMRRQSARRRRSERPRSRDGARHRRAVHRHALPGEQHPRHLGSGRACAPTCSASSAYKVDPAELAGMTRVEIEDFIFDRLTQKYQEKEDLVGADIMRQTERMVMLQVIDDQWKDHLLSMDHLKEGIGLRGYGQKDPLVEYKKESFDPVPGHDGPDRGRDHPVSVLPAGRARPGTRRCCRSPTKTKREDEEERREPRSRRSSRSGRGAVHHPGLHAQYPAQEGKGDGRAAIRRRRRQRRTANKQVIKSDKVGRNDPCPCGSGKKYKKCHGQAA